MRCSFYSYCDEPKYLCCTFCTVKNCDSRCHDDFSKCKYYEKGSVEIDAEKTNHVMRKKQHDELVSAKVSVDISANKTTKPLAKEVVKKQTVKAQLKSQKTEPTVKKTATKIKPLKTSTSKTKAKSKKMPVDESQKVVLF